MWNPLAPPKVRTYSVRPPPHAALPGSAPVRYVYFDGEKFPGGWGATDIVTPDYWTLRQRSADLFKRNIYARGLIRTLVTNIIATGLFLESTPEEKILGLEEDVLADWSEEVEIRFSLWARDPQLCDYSGLRTFGALQALAMQEAKVVGDVLVVLRQDPVFRSPKIQLINGSRVRTPLEKPKNGNSIKHGVEVDSFGRHVGFWVAQEDGTSKRLPAYGEKSGRRLAWLVYGSDRRLDDIRGEPLLSICLQSLKEIDRYRDSTQRKATVNSYLAMWVSKGQDKPGTLPLTGGAIRRSTAELATDTQGQTRTFGALEHIPGYVVQELQQGEEPKGFPATGTDEKFGDFEAAILQPYAWANQIPPEVLVKAFRNNYSASQAALNEFKIFLNVARTEFGAGFCEPIYNEWLPAEIMAGRMQADGFLEAWRDPRRLVEINAWLDCDWSGNVKPAVDLSKLVGGYEKLIAMGAITRDRAARELTGMKFSRVVEQLKRENEELAEANTPMVALEQSAKAPPPTNGTANDQGVDGEPTDQEDPEDNPAGALRAVGS